MSLVNLKLNKVNPIKLELIYGSFMFVIMLLMMILFSLFSGAMMSLIPVMNGSNFPTSQDSFPEFFGGGMLLIVAIFGSIFYFIFGFLFGWIGGVILNLILPKIGGLDLTFQAESVKITEKQDNL